MQALHYNNYAWVLIMLRRSADDVAVAADYIRRAFAMAPWIPAIRGTLAAVRIELGEYEAGIEEALAVADEYRREHSPVANENRGSTLATAALGCFRLGERENAAELLAEAQRLAPEDIAVRQAAAEINASPVL